MITNDLIDKFYEDVNSLGLKFPVAAIQKATGFNKGTISEYLNKKQQPSENFLEAFYKSFDKSLKKVSRNTNTFELKEELRKISAWQAHIDSTLGVLITELLPIMADFNGKSAAAVSLQLKKDIAEETRNRVDELNNKAGS